MAVTTDKTNKPILPRGADVRPIDSYNRAALYSGKALDFDGVNDYVDAGTLDITGYTAISISAYVKVDSFASTSVLLSIQHTGPDDVRIVFTSTGKIELGLDDGTFYRVFTDAKTNEWYFATLTFDGTTLKGYLNGVEFDSIAASFNFSTATGVINLGQRVGTGFSYNGQISNTKVFNTALTAAQVADLYNNPEKIVPTGVANTALKLWLPMQEGAGTTAYDGSADLTDYVTNGDFSDGTNNWTASNATLSVEGGALKITSTGGNRPQGYQTITGLTVGRKYLLSAVARVGTTLHNMEIEISGIGASGLYNKTTSSTDTYIYTEFTAGSTTHIIQAKIDDSSVAAGQTGYFDDIKLLDLGNYGSISGATWVQGVGAPVAQTAVIDWNKWYLDHTNEVLIPQGLTSGRDLLGNLFENVRKQGALNLDGNSWGKVHPNNSLAFATGAFSMEAWAKLEYINTGSYANEIIALNDSDSWAIKTLSTGPSFKAGNTALSHTKTLDNSWAHIVGVRNADGSMKLYINGVEKESAAAGSSTSNLNNDNPLRLGTDASDSSRAYKDQIAQPRIYNRALTASEVLNNYNVTKDLYI